MIGRNKEIQQYQAILYQGYGLLGFFGLGGIGKTTLLEALMELSWQYEYETVWLDSSNIVEPLDFIDKLLGKLISTVDGSRWAKLSKLYAEYKERRANLDRHTDLRGTQIANIRIGSLSKVGDITVQTNIGKVEDNFQQRQNLANWALAELVIAIRYEGIKIAIFVDSLEWLPEIHSQDISGFLLSLSEVAVVACAGRKIDPRLAKQQLQELSLSEACQLLSRLNVKEEFIKVIVKMTKIPFCLTLAAQYSHLPNSSPQAFMPYSVSTDEASFVTDYVRKLILDRLRDDDSHKRQKRSKAVADLLEYGCVLTELTPLLICRTLGRVKFLNRSFANYEYVQELMSDGLLKSHTVNSRPPRFHDLIQELASATLRNEQPEIYRLVHLKAAEYYANQLSPSRKSQTKKWLSGSFPVELTVARLSDEAFANWRSNFIKYIYHLSRTIPQASIALVKDIFANVYKAHYQLFCKQVLQSVDLHSLSPQDRAWLQNKSVSVGFLEPEPTLRKLLSHDISEISREVWMSAATRLLHAYLTDKKPVDVIELIHKIESAGEVFPSKEAASLYFQLGKMFWKTSDYEKAVSAFKKALSLEEDPKTKAEIKLNMVVSLKAMRDYTGAANLAEQVIFIWEKLDDPANLAAAHIALGDVSRAAGNWKKAKGAYQTAIEVLETATFINEEAAVTVYDRGFRRTIHGSAYGALSRYYLKARDLDRARKLLLKGLEILNRGGDPYSHHGWMKRLLGQALMMANDCPSATVILSEALVASEQAGNVAHQAMNLICLRDIYAETNNTSALQIITDKLEKIVMQTGKSSSEWEAKVHDDISPLSK